MYIVAHLQANLEVLKNTTHLDNLICKVTMTKTNLSHEHLGEGSTHAPRVKLDVIYLYLNKSI